MHIAICNDNVADRKQMERLLKREADKCLSASEALYIDSFGSKASLLLSPIVYNAYFLSLVIEKTDLDSVISYLQDNRVFSPIILYKSDTLCKMAGDFFFLTHPVKTDELSLLMNQLFLKYKQEKVPTIEFRNEKDTFYIKETDFLYCLGTDRKTEIYLTDGTKKETSYRIRTLWMDFEPFPSLYLANKNTIVNSRYISRVLFFSILLTSGEKIKIAPKYRSEIKQMIRTFQ